MTEENERQDWINNQHGWLYETYMMNTSMCRSLRSNAKELKSIRIA